MSKTLSWLYGIGFLALAGLRAFQESDLVLGLFEVDRMHSMIHLASGILGVLAGIAGAYPARLYLCAVGLLFGTMTGMGFATGNLLGMALNRADNVLNLVIGALALHTILVADPPRGTGRIPITGRRGVTDFREPAHHW